MKTMYDKIISALKGAKKVGIFTHISPDGDAMGSSYSLKLALQSIGKSAEVYLLPNADTKAQKLIIGQEQSGLKASECDLLVALDCADSKRLGEYEKFFISHPNTAAIDHHITHIPYAKLWIAYDISSTCEAMPKIIDSLGVQLTHDIAQNLYIGIATDTGSFKYSCVTPDTMRTAAVLLEAGIDNASISKQLFTVKSKEYYQFMQRALNKLQYFENGKICVLVVSQEDFELSGITEPQSSEIVSLPLSIEGTDVGVYIRSRGEGEYKISLRSSSSVDAAKIAAHFGGGGHIRASGYSAFNATPEEIIHTLINEIKKQLQVNYNAK